MRGLITLDRGIAEDCVQEAMVRVHRHWGRVRRDTAAVSYSHRAVLNAALSWRRRRRIREVPLDLAGGSLRSVGFAADPMVDGVSPALLTALRSLPPRMRAAVTLRYLDRPPRRCPMTSDLSDLGSQLHRLAAEQTSGSAAWPGVGVAVRRSRRRRRAGTAVLAVLALAGAILYAGVIAPHRPDVSPAAPQKKLASRPSTPPGT